MIKDSRIWISLILILCMFTCTEDPNCKSGKNLECGSIEWSDSDYILPYSIGHNYRVNQGNNNTCGGNQDSYKYGYDFDMPVGSVIVASRAGVVSEIRTNNPDGVNLVLGNQNLVKILHDDGTTAGYSHIKQFSILVALDQVVQQGDALGLSGNSGYTNNFPHLHFHVSTCDEPTLPGCSTLLVKFSNTTENKCGLIQNRYYEALQMVI